MKRFFAILLVTVVIMTLFVGCGNSDETSKSIKCKITKIGVAMSGNYDINWIDAEVNGKTYTLNMSDMFSDMTLESCVLPENSGIIGDSSGFLILARDSHYELTVKNGSDTYKMKLGVDMEYSAVKDGDNIKIKFDPSYCIKES
jgi:hypothetical protein